MKPFSFFISGIVVLGLSFFAIVFAEENVSDTSQTDNTQAFVQSFYSRGQQRRNMWTNYYTAQKYFESAEKFQNLVQKAQENDLSELGIEKPKNVITNQYGNYKAKLKNSVNKTKKENKNEQKITWQINQQETVQNPKTTDFRSAMRTKASEEKKEILLKNKKETSKASRELFILKNQKNKGVVAEPVKTQRGSEKGTELQYHFSNMKKKAVEE